jgi:hypothetical protein
MAIRDCMFGRQVQLYHRAIKISLKLNLRDCDRPKNKLLLLGGARFNSSVIQLKKCSFTTDY